MTTLNFDSVIESALKDTSADEIAKMFTDSLNKAVKNKETSERREKTRERLVKAEEAVKKYIEGKTDGNYNLVGELAVLIADTETQEGLDIEKIEAYSSVMADLADMVVCLSTNQLKDIQKSSKIALKVGKGFEDGDLDDTLKALLDLFDL